MVSKVCLRADEREPGLALSVLVSAALMLGLFLAGGLHFITQAAKQEASLPVEVEVSLEPATPAIESAAALAVNSATVADTRPAAGDVDPLTVAPDALDAPDIPEPAPEEAITPAGDSRPETNLTEPSGAQGDHSDAENPVEPGPPSSLAAPSSFPGNMDLMPKPRLINRLNPALAGMPMPSRPKAIDAAPAEGEGSSQATDAPESGSAAPELQVTAVSGQAGTTLKKGGGIVVQALINHLGIVEAVEILEGSHDKIADVMAANAIKQQRFRFNPPVPPGQRVLRTFTLNLSGEDLP